MYTPSLLLLGAAFAAAEVHNVDVGESGLSFEPQTLKVATGDTVIFEFYPRHNVVTGPFSSPCTPTDGDGGFYSGEFSDTDNGKKKFVVNVTSEDPMYWYCSVQKHCESGMVGGWNLPDSGDTADAYAAAAKDVNASKTPDSLKGGELLEDEAIASLTASGSASPTSSGGSSSAPSGNASTTHGGSSTSAPLGSPTSPSAGSTTPTSTAAAGTLSVGGEMGGLLSFMAGIAAFFF